ncbi:MAG: glycosyltransferase family 39 protein [Chloroflexota bacterium]
MRGNNWARSTITSPLLLLVGIAVYLSLSLYQLSLPGLHYDEAFEAVPAVQILQGQPVTAFRNSTIDIIGYQFPLTTQDYIGAVNTLGVLPFLATGGASVVSLRLYAVLVGVVTLLCVYKFTAEVTHTPFAGAIATLLLAVNPTFLFWNRQGIFVTAVTATIGVAAAWCWLRWWLSQKFRFAIGGMFLFGLGLYAKLLFIWLIVALLGCVVILKFKTLLDQAQSRRYFDLSIKQGGYLLLAGVAGGWPLLVYNIQTGGTFKSITENATTSYYGVDNTDVFTNLGARFGHLVTVLKGDHLWYLGDTYANNTLVTFFLMMAIAAVWLTVQKRQINALFPFLLLLLVIGQSVVTVSDLWVTHFALIMVWPTIAMVLAGTALYRAMDRRLGNTLLGILLVTLIITEAKASIFYHQALQASGGLGTHSDAIYDVATWLEQHPDKPAIAMDWGLTAPIIYLTSGRVESIEVFGYNWDTEEAFSRSLTPYLSPEQAIFLWRAPDEIVFDRSADFQALYRSQNLEETIVEAFYERSGRPVLGATMLVPVGTAENKPHSSP